jgi:hypothetical protein
MAASSPTCRICGEQAARVLQTPTSYLHDTNIKGIPFIFVIVTPVCEREECEEQAREGVRLLIEDRQMREALERCFVCKKGERDGKTPMKCQGCMMIAYCSRECQKVDWKRHRKMCGSRIWTP